MRRYTKRLILSLLVFFSTLAHAQSGYFKIENLKASEHFSFPVLHADSAGSLTVQTINQHLQLAELQLIKGHESSDLFEVTSRDNETIYGGKIYLAYTNFANTPKLLSIKLNESSCGATCFYWSAYYTFNAGNGDAIELKDVFSAPGFEQFRKQAIAKMCVHFRKNFIHNDSIGVEDTLSVLECYQNSDLDDFYIDHDSIFIDSENCLMKYQHFFGWDMTTGLALDEFKNYLNDYGRTIFGITNHPVAAYRSVSLPQIFEGSIGNSPVILLFRYEFDEVVSGVYAYLKHGRGIYLEGTLDGQMLSLTEKDNQFKDKAYLKAVYDGNQIRGTWKNKTKMLKFTLKRK